MSDPPLFQWRHFDADIILCAGRWYLHYAWSYRDVEELLQDRGVGVDHTTVFRWVQRDAPELDRRCRPFPRATNDSDRVDETYVKVNKQWHSLYRAGIVVIVRKGAPKPDISSPDALKRTLLAAKSLSYVDPASGGASGIHFAKVLERLGIAHEMHAKTVFPNPKTPAAVGVVVANGEAEIGMHIVQGVISVAGIDVVGPLPGDLQDTIVFAAAIMANAKDAEASKALVNFLRTPEAAAVIKAKGMEPAAS